MGYFVLIQTLDWIISENFCNEMNGGNSMIRLYIFFFQDRIEISILSDLSINHYPHHHRNNGCQSTFQEIKFSNKYQCCAIILTLPTSLYYVHNKKKKKKIQAVNGEEKWGKVKIMKLDAREGNFDVLKNGNLWFRTLRKIARESLKKEAPEKW